MVYAVLYNMQNEMLHAMPIMKIYFFMFAQHTFCHEMSVFLRQKSIVDHCVQTPAKDVTTQHRRNMWKQIKRRGKKIDDDIKNDASFSSNMEMCRFFFFESHRMTNSNMFAQTASKMWNVSVLFCMHLRQLIVFTLYLLKIYHFSIRHYHFVP